MLTSNSSLVGMIIIFHGAIQSFLYKLVAISHDMQRWVPYQDQNSTLNTSVDVGLSTLVNSDTLANAFSKVLDIS